MWWRVTFDGAEGWLGACYAEQPTAPLAIQEARRILSIAPRDTVGWLAAQISDDEMAGIPVEARRRPLLADELRSVH